MNSPIVRVLPSLIPSESRSPCPSCLKNELPKCQWTFCVLYSFQLDQLLAFSALQMKSELIFFLKYEVLWSSSPLQIIEGVEQIIFLASNMIKDDQIWWSLLEGGYESDFECMSISSYLKSAREKRWKKKF